MNLRNHRIAAVSILVVGTVAVTAWARSVAVDPPEIVAVRERLQGHWVASVVQAGEHRKVEGASAGSCTVKFDGRLVRFRGMVGGIDAEGTYYIEKARPGWVDFKMDAGWIIGIYAFDGDELRLCVNPFSAPERLGVPTLNRPRAFACGEQRHLYTFRKAPAGG